MRVALQDLPEKFPAQPNGIVTVKINPDTGARAQPDDLDAIFEIFRAEDVPSLSDIPSTVDGSESEEVLPEELF